MVAASPESSILPAVYCPYCISLPAAAADILRSVGDILATGIAAADTMDIEKIKEVLVMLGVTASLVSCQTVIKHVGHVFDVSEIKGEYSAGGPVTHLNDEYINEIEITIKLEDKSNEKTGMPSHQGRFEISKKKKKSVKKVIEPKEEKVVKTQVRSHNCGHCDGKFSNKYNLKLHLVQVHRVFPEGMVIYKCPGPDCQFVTGSRICYNRHAVTHGGKHEVKVHSCKSFCSSCKATCSYCNMDFANRSSLKRHHQRKHSNLILLGSINDCSSGT